MKKKLLTLTLCAAAMTMQAQQLAFPGAAGWGRYALGARASSAPTVYHVTNLNDSGTGSLRDAVSKSNRIVVFDVSGVINISSRITFASNLYIAGQTAPGEGITVYGNGVSFSGANNLICRYLRVRMGKGGDSGKDCAGVSNGTNMIFDHCSFSWGLDETFSINSDGKGALGDITIQNTIMGQGLLSHSAGGLMQADHITLYRNFYCDNSTRNNKIKGTNQYANNVVYNWQNGCYIMGGDSEGQSYCNIQSNLFINGPAKGGNAFGGGNSNFHFYGSDNWQDDNLDGTFNPTLNTNNGGSDRVSTPYDYPALDLYSGKELLEKSIPTVGASLPYRDQADCYMVEELMSLGKEGKIITYESSLPIGIPSAWTWWKGEKRTDTDGDGMPDAWEVANGTNPNMDDACVKAANGYLNIENYINSITEDDRQFFLRQPVTLALKKATTNSLTLQWRDYTEREGGFAIEVKQSNGSWKEVGRTEADATEYTITDLEQAKIYDVRVRAFGDNGGVEAYSDYSAGQFTTRQVEVGILDIDTFEPDVTNAPVEDGQKLLLETDDVLDYNIESVIIPECVVAKGKGTITVSGESIWGTGSMNKAGEGTLALNNTNDYTGATVIHEGVLEAKVLANGGQPSSIGAAIADPQNLVIDGGTLRYTGTSKATDRGARLLSPSTLEVANTSSTLTMNGTFEGAGSLTIDGKGTVAITDANKFFNYSGETILKGGTLYFSDIENAAKAFGGMNKKVVMSGGSMRYNHKDADNQTHSFPIEVADGTTSTIITPSHGYMKNVVSGTGNLKLQLNWMRYYVNSTFADFDGQLIVYGAPRSGNNVLFMHEKQFNSPNLRVNLTGKTWMGAWQTNASNVVGGISGDAGTYLVGSSKQTDGFVCSWTVGGANSDETFKGIINDWSTGGSGHTGTTSIKKVGTGLWRLTGNNTYKGTTEVAEGTLIVNGKNSGTGAMSVANGAMLKGKGTVAGKVTLANGATLCPGDTLVNGSKLTVGSLSVQNGGTLLIPVVQDNDGKLVVNSIAVTNSLTATTGARLELDMSRVGNYQFKRNDAICVFYNAGNMTSAAGQFTVTPATPGEGLEWETATLLTDGILRVKSAGEDYDGPITTTQHYNATLDHTASVQGGSNTVGKFLDGETHYYNNWGTTSWVAQMYAQFSYDIAAAEEITKAELTFTVNCGGKYDNRALDVNYMPVGTKRITTTADIPELTAKVGTSVVAYTDISRTYTTRTVDATEAVQAMHSAGQDYVTFIFANGVAGGEIYGKGSTTKMPTLSITTTYETTGIRTHRDTSVKDNGVIYNLSGQRINDNMLKNRNGRKGIVIQNGKKYVW